MITIERIRLELQAEHESFAYGLYGRWDGFCRTAVEKVIEDTLARYDQEDEVIRIEALEIDLGLLPEVDFYDSFPRRLAGKLDEVFADCMRYQEKYPVEVISLQKDRLEVLLQFLFQGIFPAGGPGGIAELSRLLRIVVHENGWLLIRRLRQQRHPMGISERLAFQFSDADLELLVGVAEPAEAVFINLYTRYLIVTHRRLDRPEITADHFRDVIWQTVLSYLLFEGRSFFSRKQMVAQTVHRLALHFNLEFHFLLELLLTGLERFTEEWMFIPELLTILSGIREDMAEEVPTVPAVVLWLTSADGVSADRRKVLCRLLSVSDTCHRLLLPLKEEEIMRLTEFMIPQEAPFVVSYAACLEQEKERGMLEGKAGPEFRVLKWEFLFLVLLSVPVSSFHRRQFVWQVIRQMAAHYNLEAMDLLSWLYAEAERLPLSLTEVMRELYWQQTEDWMQGFAVPEERKWQEEELTRLCYLLGRPDTARRFLQGKPESQIQGWIGVMIPSESRFILSYACALDRGKDQGLLEGKAGGEFRLLKWEFIFGVMLNGPLSAFARKQFVSGVIRQIATHYNLLQVWLLGYFYQCLEAGGLEETEYLRMIVQELWEEEKGIAQGGALLATEGSLLPGKESGKKPDNERKYLTGNKVELIKSSLKMNEPDQVVQPENRKPGEVRFYISNAGMVLTAPYLPRLFSMLELTDKGVFVSTEAQVKAIFLLQQMVYGEQREVLETDLILNKLLVDWNPGMPLPRSMMLAEKEVSVVDSLIAGMKGNWDKLSNTSAEGLRVSFLIREGMLQEAADRWVLTVEQRGYDVLMDSLPWSFSPVKFPWMQKPVYVKWR